jgi:hypothetical protein
MCVLLQVPSRFVQGSKPAGRFCSRFGDRKSLAHELLGAQVEVRADLVVDIPHDDVVAPKREAKEFANAGSDHYFGLTPAAALR